MRAPARDQTSSMRPHTRSKHHGLWLVAVAQAWFGQRMAGPGGVFLELAAKPRHVEPEVVRPVLEARTPHVGQQLGRAHQLTGAAQQYLQEAPLGGSQAWRGGVGRIRSNI